jgi:putative transposase
VKVEIRASEMVQVFTEIQEQPEKILEMVRADMPQAVGGYLSKIMRLELTRFRGAGHPLTSASEMLCAAAGCRAA